jgi:hypothetical protein
MASELSQLDKEKIIIVSGAYTISEDNFDSMLQAAQKRKGILGLSIHR